MGNAAGETTLPRDPDFGRQATYHDVAHGATLALPIGGDDDVDVLHDALEGLIELLGLQLQLQQSPVHLVHHEHRLDALGDGLPQHGLCLHAHT